MPLRIDQNIILVSSELDGQNNTLFIIHFSVKDQRIVIVPVEGNQEIEVTGGYGKYKLAKVYPLLSIDKKDTEFVTSAMSIATGVVVDQVIETSLPSAPLDHAQLSTILRTNLIQQGLHPKAISQLAKLYFFTKDVPGENVYQATMINDTTKLVSTLNQTVDHECSLAVVNTTAVPKLASRMSSVLENSGWLVVRVDDSTTTVDKTSVSFDQQNEECQTIAQRLKSIIPSKLQMEDQQAQRQEYRADLVLMIGDDVANQLNPD